MFFIEKAYVFIRSSGSLSKSSTKWHSYCSEAARVEIRRIRPILLIYCVLFERDEQNSNLHRWNRCGGQAEMESPLIKRLI
jgi:hypothetical protein